MRSITVKIGGVAVLAAIGGGLASALLSIVTMQKTSAALALGCLSPLPIMLAGLSFGSPIGLSAAVVGSLVIGLFELSQGGLAPHAEQFGLVAVDVLVYAVSLAIPAWWLSRLLVSVRAAPSSAVADKRKLGLILTSAIIFSTVGVALDFLGTVAAHGGFRATMDMMVQVVEPYVETQLVGGRQLPMGVDVHRLAVATTWAQMPILAASSLVSLGVNLWLAARITRASGRFPAPWPDLPRGLRVPRPLALVLAATLGLAFAGGLAGMLALILAGALVMAFTVQGIAVIHDVTRGKSYRFPLLIIVYLSLPWLLLFHALVGLCDAGFSFRDRPKPATTGKS